MIRLARAFRTHQSLAAAAAANKTQGKLSARNFQRDVKQFLLEEEEEEEVAEEKQIYCDEISITQVRR